MRVEFTAAWLLRRYHAFMRQIVRRVSLGRADILLVQLRVIRSCLPSPECRECRVCAHNSSAAGKHVRQVDIRRIPA